MQDDGDGLSQDEVSAEDVREERDRRIAELYATQSAEQIARTLGLSTQTIYLVTKKLGVSKKKGRPSRTLEEAAIDPDHVKIGARFSGHTAFKMKLDNVDVAKALGWSPQKVKAIAQGNHDLTLTDLKTMAAFIGWSVSMLLDGI